MAMAEIFVSSVVSIFLENINSLVLDKLELTGGMETEVERLQSTLSTIQTVLSDAEVKQRKSAVIRNWLQKLKHTAYETQNILDDIAANTRKRSKVNAVLKFPNQLSLAHNLKDVREKLDNIAEERFKFHLRERVEHVDDGNGRETSSLVNESEVYGRDEELEKAIGMVLNNSADPVFVYTICGMGGLGKTTLAQLVYNHQSVKEAFDLRGWVCVSDDFDVKRLTKDIIESIGGNCKAKNLDPLQRHLQKELKDKRFFLVLDDVWNENHNKWEELKKAFTCGKKGSTVIVTTRIKKIASMMTTVSIHHLGCLSDDDSWSLFKQRAFQMGKSEDYPNLEALGREIVKKCGGVPLAIKALGGTLRFKEREAEWLFVKQRMICEIDEEIEEDGGNNKILEVLRLSYNHLNAHLKQCFSFCSIFPKDLVMEKERLIQLWMANGFIPSKGRMHLHDRGSQIFNELAQRSFFQELDVHGYDTCKMHDLIHDLAQSIMSDECCMIQSEHQELTVSKTVRHLSASLRRCRCEDCVSSEKNLLKVSSLHSIIECRERPWHESELDYGIIEAKQKYLRALELALGGNIMEISLDSFRHLKYLTLYRFIGKTLPDSICNLDKLQTLKLRSCDKLQSLPEGMTCLKNLIYLDMRYSDSLTCTPPRLGQLSSLRVLTKFIVGKKQGFFIEELKELKLEGELDIRELHNVECLEDARDANLKMKPDLRVLKLCWREDNKYNSEANDEEVLDGLQPHSNLKELTIENYHGTKFSNWLMDFPLLSYLTNLTKLSLKDCERCECLPPLGKLQSLKQLFIWGMNALKCIDYSFCGDGDGSFPSLDKLEFIFMPSLEVWETVNGNDNFPLLSSLVIHACPKLKNLDNIQHLSTLQDLTIFRCEGLTCLPNGIQNLTLLSELRILCCSNLMCLPQGMQSLTALTKLDIRACPHLENLCERDTGEDWPIIAHIPDIVIKSEL